MLNKKIFFLFTLFIATSSFAADEQKLCECPLKYVDGSKYSEMEWKDGACYHLTCKPGDCGAVNAHAMPGGAYTAAKTGLILSTAMPGLNQTECNTKSLKKMKTKKKKSTSK